VIRVALPVHMRTLAGVAGEVELEVKAPVTAGAIVDALEARFPMLRGTIRDHAGLKRRAYVRFFVDRRDWSHEPLDAPVPAVVAEGDAPFVILGALAGG